MAHRKAGGSTALGRDSEAKRLGLKVGAKEKVKAGMILVRQRGTPYRPGLNVGKGKDDTLYALTKGRVYINKRKIKNFTGKLKLVKIINVKPC